MGSPILDKICKSNHRDEPQKREGVFFFVNRDPSKIEKTKAFHGADERFIKELSPAVGENIGTGLILAFSFNKVTGHRHGQKLFLGTAYAA
jgi:hypothetical protein